MRQSLLARCMLLAVSLLVGCGAPSKVNVALRKQNQDLQAKVDELTQQHAGDVASMTVMKSGTTQPAVSPGQLATLFTVTSLKVNDRFTGFRDPGLKVYLTPVDSAGDPLKTAGAFTVDAFDLKQKESPAIGHWDFPISQAANLWQQSPLFVGYLLPCTMPSLPADELTVKVTFVDGLTQRSLSAQTVVKPTTQPAK